MSSEKEIVVSNLALTTSKKRPVQDDSKIVVRRVTAHHGYPQISIPKSMGLKLNQEVVIQKIGSNPFSWEIVIKPADKK